MTAFRTYHYTAIAELLLAASMESENAEQVAVRFSKMLANDNPRFKPNKFLKAAGITNVSEGN